MPSPLRSFRRTVQIPSNSFSTCFTSGGDGGIAHFISPSPLRSVEPEASSSLNTFLALVSQVAETEGLLISFRHLRFAPSNPRLLHPSIHSLHLFHKWRRRRDSNPRNPFEVRFFSKEVLSATQSRLRSLKGV